MHTLLLVPFQTGHGNCRFTRKYFPMVEKQNGGYYTLRDRGTILFGFSFLYIYVFLPISILIPISISLHTGLTGREWIIYNPHSRLCIYISHYRRADLSVSWRWSCDTRDVLVKHKEIGLILR